MLKAYRYRIYPNEEQKILLEKMFGSIRFVYNWGLEKKLKAYQADKAKLSFFDLCKKLPKLKEENPWIKEIPSQSLQIPLKNLDVAFTSFFKKNSRFPKFKSKHFSRKSCQFPQNVKVDFNNNLVMFPKLRQIKSVLHRRFEGEIKTCTIVKNSSGKYYTSILVDDGKELPKKSEVTEQSTLGIDVGIKHFATLSNGEKIGNPKFLRKSENRLKILQRRMSKKQKESQNRKEDKLRVAIQHEK